MTRFSSTNTSNIPKQRVIVAGDIDDAICLA
jgi:hypothetical protein